MAEPSRRDCIIHMPPEQQPMATPQQSLAYPWTAAEKRLNYFVGALALLERLGNCLGTLAFTWATVVVLGGFSTNLGEDFWYATAIIFLEAFRVFSRESRSDDELLFKTTGSIRLKRMKLSRGIPYYLLVSIVIVCMYGALEFSLPHYGYRPPPHLRLQYHILLLSVLLALASVAQAPQAAEYLKDHAWLQFLTAAVAVLALGSAMIWSHVRKREILLIILPLSVGCLQSIFKEIVGAWLQKSRCNMVGWYGLRTYKWLGTLVSLILPAWIVISVLVEFGSMGILILLGTLLLSNIQVPMAVARIVISVERLYIKDNSRNAAANEHLMPALTIFYSMVLAQGVLYLAACILESLLSSPVRRSFAESCKLNYETGYESINLYYEHAYNKRMAEGVLVQEDMGLVTFALNSLDSNSNVKKLAAVQILYTLLKRLDVSNARLVSEITNSTKVVASLIDMLGWTSASDDNQGINIRLYSANIIASLAGNLRIVGIPGTMQMVSLLLDDGVKNKEKQDISNQLLDNCELNIKENQQRSHASATLVEIKGERGYHAPINGQEKSKLVEGGNKSKKSYNGDKFLDYISNMLRPIEGDDPLKEKDLFLLGMLILEGLTHDLDNCKQIIKATGLIPKIIGVITNVTNKTDDKLTSSLHLIAKLATTEEEQIGMTIKQKILDEPFFLGNLVEILVDNNNNNLKSWKSTIVIIAKVIILEDQKSNKYVDIYNMIIPKLLDAFLDLDESSNKKYDLSLRLRMLVGEALSKLAKNTSFCKTILQEKGNGLIGDLKNIFQQDEYTYVAAKVLSNLCAYYRDPNYDMLCHPIPSEQLSSILREVLEKIPKVEGKQLEALLMTASQLHNIIPEKFAQELESSANRENLVQKLVDELNSNKKMCLESPRMRKAIVEITVYIVELCPRYSLIFKNKSMLEALSKVEIILMEVEKYKALFVTKDDVFKKGLPSLDLVIKAKQLIDSETPNQHVNLRGSSSVDIVHFSLSEDNGCEQ